MVRAGTPQSEAAPSARARELSSLTTTVPTCADPAGEVPSRGRGSNTGGDVAGCRPAVPAILIGRRWGRHEVVVGGKGDRAQTYRQTLRHLPFPAAGHRPHALQR